MFLRLSLTVVLANWFPPNPIFMYTVNNHACYSSRTVETNKVLLSMKILCFFPLIGGSQSNLLYTTLDNPECLLPFDCISIHLSDQIIATSHDLTPNGGLVSEIPLFQGNLGWWNIIQFGQIYQIFSYIQKNPFLYPIGSMYGKFNYMYHKNQPNVGKYTITESYGY